LHDLFHHGAGCPGPRRETAASPVACESTGPNATITAAMKNALSPAPESGFFETAIAIATYPGHTSAAGPT
jgi:hypothetical protein